MATILDVAKKANVSVATVSRVINNSSHKVNSRTREKVLSVIKELDYYPNAVAKSLQMKKTDTLGVIIPDISNPYYAEIVRGIQDSAEEIGFSVFFQNTDRDRRKVICDVSLFREKHVEGIIFSGGVLQQEELLPALGHLRGKAVVIGRQELDIPSIRIDNKAITIRAVDHLIALGFRSIGFIGGPKESTTSKDRLEGYLEGVKNHSCSLCEEHILSGKLTLESGYKKTEQMLSGSNTPSAIICANDLMAFGAIKAIKDHGLRVPGDIGVIGFDNVPLTGYFDPAVTTIDIPRYEIGTEAVKKLFRQINGEEVEHTSWFECQLIARSSTKRNIPV